MSTSITRRRLLALGSSVVLGGCYTTSVWRDSGPQYAEEIDAIMLSDDGKTLVFLGPDYHYIFDAPTVLVETIHAPELHGFVTARLANFRVDRQGKITGSVALQLPLGSTQDSAARLAKEKAWAKATTLGYGPNGDVDITLSGTRYSSTGFTLPTEYAHRTTLSKRYTVQVIEPDTGKVLAAKILATPITIAGDGLLVLGGIVLTPIALGYIMFLAAMQK